MELSPLHTTAVRTVHRAGLSFELPSVFEGSLRASEGKGVRMGFSFSAGLEPVNLFPGADGFCRVFI